jgi:hypothetical protein
VSLDEQYRWSIKDGVRDAQGNPKTIGVGIENERVVVNTHGYASLDEDAADVLKYSVETATAVVRQQRRQQRRRS